MDETLSTLSMVSIEAWSSAFFICRLNGGLNPFVEGLVYERRSKDSDSLKEMETHLNISTEGFYSNLSVPKSVNSSVDKSSLPRLILPTDPVNLLGRKRQQKPKEGLISFSPQHSLPCSSSASHRSSPNPTTTCGFVATESLASSLLSDLKSHFETIVNPVELISIVEPESDANPPVRELSSGDKKNLISPRKKLRRITPLVFTPIGSGIV